jgi:hypothetical protein
MSLQPPPPKVFPPAADLPALPGSDPERAVPPAAGAGPTVSFWHKPWAQDLVAFSTSLAFHVTLLVLGLIVYQELPNFIQPVQEQIIIPEATIIEGAEVGGIPNPGLGGDPNMAAAQNVDPNVTVAEGWSDKRSQTLSQNLMGGGGSEVEPDSLIGIGLLSGLGSGQGAGSGRGDGIGAGSGDGGPMAPFGVPGGGGGLGPKSPFMGISGNAKYVAYVCDSSGSMLNKFPALKVELRKAIDVLRPIQAFSIIFFSDPERRPQTLAQSLVMATPDRKREAHKFLDSVSTSGSTDPIPGLELAFNQKPQLIYLLTDGDFPDNQAVLDRIRVLNREKRVKISTIVFVDASNADESIITLMKQIAAENGGVFRMVSQYDL